MFFTDIFPYLNCFNLFKTNVTQSIRQMNSVYHARLTTPQRNLKTEFSFLKRIKCLLSAIEKYKKGFRMRKSRAGKSHFYRAVIAFKSSVLRGLWISQI